VGDVVSERSIVGKEEESDGRGVEAAYGDEPGDVLRYKLGDHLAATLVVESRQVAGGFVQGERGVRKGELDRMAIQENVVGWRGALAQRSDAAVQSHSSSGDQCFSLAAGGGGAATG
jgi:hypothetical protein